MKHNKMISVCFTAITSAVAFFLFTGCSGNTIEGPAIRFEKPAHNFGEVDEGTDVTVTFKFTNPGSESLVINGIYPSCGCMVTGDYDREVGPGKRGTIPVVFDTSGLQGQTVKTIKIATNADEGEPQVITIEGYIRVAVEVHPKTLALGEIDDTTKILKGEVILINKTNDPMQIREVTSPERTTIGSVTIEPDKQYSIQITVGPPFDKGYIQQKAVIKTNLKQKPEIVIDYSYFYPPLIDVKPEAFYVFPSDFEMAEISRTFYIYSRWEKPLEIKDVVINKKPVNYLIDEIEPGRVYKITFSFNPGSEYSYTDPPNITFRIPNAPERTDYSIPIKDGNTASP
ncbi:MAG: DUF1573 domain-containing protein [Spirochaetales bacterium]|nr:DUF1573 domain-containing protein [Spirochaetales bacterium]